MNDPRGRKRVATRFGRAAGSYDDAASVQRAICEDLSLLARIHPPSIGPILEAGCGTGHWLPRLSQAHPDRALIAMDLAEPMLARLRANMPAQAALAGDIHRMPLRSAAFGAIWSSLCLQWCDPAAAMREFARVLAPGGVLWLATLGPDTFGELRSAFGGIDTSRHVLDCAPPEAIEAAADAAGLTLLERRRQHKAARAPTLRALLQGVKAIGAQGVGAGRRRGLLGRQAWREVQARYETYRAADGMLPLSYDALLMIFRKSL